MCGDGKLYSGDGGTEVCDDDGNQVNTDACLNTCVAAKCGDGVLQTGVEECEDGNQVNTDACLNTCKNAKCGDGVVKPDTEFCDDGNAVDADNCTNACKTGAGLCPHSVCTAGENMHAAACTYTGANNDCVTRVCNTDPFCCNNSWDSICVNEAKNPAICPTGGNPNAFTCGCSHSDCTTGAALTGTCDPCVKKICEVDPFCCTTSWDSLCVGETNSVCQIPAGALCS